MEFDKIKLLKIEMKKSCYFLSYRLILFLSELGWCQRWRRLHCLAKNLNRWSIYKHHFPRIWVQSERMLEGERDAGRELDERVGGSGAGSSARLPKTGLSICRVVLDNKIPVASWSLLNWLILTQPAFRECSRGSAQSESPMKCSLKVQIRGFIPRKPNRASLGSLSVWF